MQLPSKSPVTMPFGSTTSPYSPSSPHKGTDFAYIPDNTVYAPFSGKVTLKPNNGNDGNGVYMTEPNGRYHGLLHTSKYLISNGQQVSEGQPIAVMGQTGFAQGIHLHWAVKENNKFIDPMSLITKEEEVIDLNAARLLCRLAFYHEPENDNFTSTLVGKDIFTAIRLIEALPERKNMTALLKSKTVNDPEAIDKLNKIKLILGE